MAYSCCECTALNWPRFVMLNAEDKWRTVQIQASGIDDSEDFTAPPHIDGALQLRRSTLPLRSQVLAVSAPWSEELHKPHLTHADIDRATRLVRNDAWRTNPSCIPLIRRSIHAGRETLGTSDERVALTRARKLASVQGRSIRVGQACLKRLKQCRSRYVHSRAVRATDILWENWACYYSSL